MVNALFNGTRRDVILSVGAGAVLGVTAGACASQQEVQMTAFNTRDDVTIYYKDWGPRDGEVVILSHGWPLNSDSWESQAFHLASNGYRVITHDRRGHGRSSQPWDGNDMDHYADDLAQLIERLNVRNVSLFRFSTGGGEVARYVGRHGTSRVARLGLISAVPPLMLRTDSEPATIYAGRESATGGRAPAGDGTVAAERCGACMAGEAAYGKHRSVSGVYQRPLLLESPDGSRAETRRRVLPAGD